MKIISNFSVLFYNVQNLKGLKLHKCSFGNSGPDKRTSRQIQVRRAGFTTFFKKTRAIGKSENLRGEGGSSTMVADWVLGGYLHTLL